MVTTEIVCIDERGNAVLDISKKMLFASGIELGDAIKISFSGGDIILNIPVFSGYYCKTNETLLLVSDERCVITVRHGNAEKRYRFSEKTSLSIELVARRRYWEQENAYSFDEIRDKSYYSDVESFANFRSLFPNGSMFFRAASPFDNAYGRSEAVLNCVKKYAINTIIDVADSPTDFSRLEYANQYMLNCSIFPIGNDAGLYSEEFAKTIARAINIIICEQGPYLIHCRAGKRRSGFLAAVLQGLSGMKQADIEADYMVSYINNNGITYATNPQRFEYLQNDTIRKILIHIRNGDTVSNLSTCVSKYLNSIGVPQPIVLQLVDKLSEEQNPR